MYHEHFEVKGLRICLSKVEYKNKKVVLKQLEIDFSLAFKIDFVDLFIDIYQLKNLSILKSIKSDYSDKIFNCDNFSAFLKNKVNLSSIFIDCEGF